MTISKEEAKEKLKKLVNNFSENPKYWDSKPEEDIKHLFIEPLFEEVLGWDRKDVSKEQRVLKGRADYILRNGNQEVFVIEAKKTNVSLNEEEGRQAVSYAYHRKIKFAVLTNFKDLRVYHALSNIKRIDGNLLKKDGAYFRINFSELLEKFDLLWLLSKESFEKKEINKLLSAKDEKLNKPIDENILADLLNIRDWLSKEIKSKKNYLTQEIIDEIVQIFIDRLIFIRSVEDRGLEPMNYLKSLESDVREQRVKLQLFPYLLEKFEEFNKKYDSKLFEKGLLEKEGSFSDSILRKVILALYFGSEGTQERYLFDSIPGDLFGSIYEQYLGTILAGTEKRVKLDSASGKRKKMGIYYTPSYIVEYIIKNAVGECVKNKSIDEILNVKIVDPACGSGSFLIRAFQEICDRIEELLKEKKFSEKYMAFKGYNERLNLAQKTSILTNCIYGVDLDEKAVELARLNLLLKMLEGEGQDTKVSKLPELVNIKCGNSLIDDPNISDKSFNWNAQFKEVFAQDGFDVVVGNPPYIRIQTLDKKDIDYFNKIYISPEKNYDIYVLFIEKGYNLLKKDGKLGFILPNKFFTGDYGKNIRNFIIENRGLNKIIDFRDYQIFGSATTYTCLLFLSKEKNKKFSYNTPQGADKLDIGILEDNFLEKSSLDLPIKDSSWSFSNNQSLEIMNKLNKIETKLKNVSSSIFQGMVTGADRYYFVRILENRGDKLIVKNNLSEKKYYIEKEIVKKLLKGREIRKWFVEWEGYSVLYPYDLSEEKPKLIEIDRIKKEYPCFFKYLKDYENDLKSREENKFKEEKNWYKFGRTQNIDKFKNKKIITQVLSNSNKFALDSSGEYYFVGGGNAGGYGIVLNKENKENYELLLGLLNSKLLEFYLKNISTCFRGGYYSYGKRFIENLPIKFSSVTQENRIRELVKQMIEFQNKYHDEKTAGHEKERLKQQIENIGYEIDSEVYKIYGITPEEQKIIEKNLK